MPRRVVNLKSRDPAADLPYSSAIVASGEFVFTSGHVGFLPDTGGVPAGVRAQTEQSLENLRRVLEASGSALDQAVKATVYLTDRDDYEAMNEVYRRFFPDDRPARTTVVVDLVRPDLLVEIEIVALVPPGEAAS